MDTIVSFPGLGLELALNRVAFSIGSFEIYWYGVLIGLGLALGIVYALKNARRFGIDSDRMLDVIIVGTIAGVVGARLYYVIFATPGEFTSIMDIFDMRKGGVAFYGMVIFAVLSAVVMCKARKVKLLPMLDIATIGFLIGQGIGRWGNFVNQEAFGINTKMPWGMTSDTVVRYLTNNTEILTQHGIFVDPTMPVHPTFLYESLWCLLGFIVLASYVKKRKFDGEIALMYFAWNGIGRAVIEGLRTDSLYFGGFRVSQVLAVVGAAVAIAIVFVIRLKIAKANDPAYLIPYGKTEQCEVDLELIEQERENAKTKHKNKDKVNQTEISDTVQDEQPQEEIIELITEPLSDEKSKPVTPTKKKSGTKKPEKTTIAKQDVKTENKSDISTDKINE